MVIEIWGLKSYTERAIKSRKNVPLNLGIGLFCLGTWWIKQGIKVISFLLLPWQRLVNIELALMLAFLYWLWPHNLWCSLVLILMINEVNNFFHDSWMQNLRYLQFAWAFPKICGWIFAQIEKSIQFWWQDVGSNNCIYEEFHFTSLR